MNLPNHIARALPMVLLISSAPENRATAAPVATAPLRAAKTPAMSVPLADEAAFFAALDLERPELKAVKTAADARDWTAAKIAWARHLDTRTSPQWLWSRRDKAQIIRLLNEKDGGLTRYIASADQVLARKFNPQGVPYQFERKINWQLKQSEETHVMSRMSYWRDLGLAYWATGEAKYAEDFVAILGDWLDDNPLPTDLSGAQKHNTRWRTLEAGIRVDTWLDAMEMFSDAPQFDAQAKYRMSKSLLEHARYLHAWNTIYRRGNWQVVETSGLSTLGILFPEAREAPAWRERGFALLAEHMQKDVFSDGTHSEFTPGYHTAVMDQFTRVSELCRRNGYAVPGLLERHEKMFDWLLRIGKPDRHAPSVGDARNPDIEGDMATGALLYNRSDMKFLGAPSGPASWVWLFGADAFERYAKIPSRRPDFTSLMTPDSKYLVMRTGWEKNDKYFLFGAAPYGGGHSHNDRLQVTLFAGRDLLIDPGIYSYNQPLALTYFRTGAAHNVLLIDGKEQPRFNPQVLAWQTTPGADFGAAFTLQDGVRHQRSVLFVKPNYYVVVDHVTSTEETGKGDHEIKRLFHFPLGEAKFDARSARTTFPTGMNVQVQSADASRLEAGEGWVPTGGATASAAPTAIFVSKGALPMTLVTVLTPFSAATALPQVELQSKGSDPVARLKISFPDGQQDEIAVAAQPSALAIGAHQTTGHALIVRRGAVDLVTPLP